VVQFLSSDAFGYCAMSQKEFLVCEKRCRNSCYTSLHSNPIYGNLFQPYLFTQKSLIW